MSELWTDPPWRSRQHWAAFGMLFAARKAKRDRTEQQQAERRERKAQNRAKKKARRKRGRR